MATYISFLNFTEQGVKTIKDLPARITDGRQSLEAKGGKIVQYYPTLSAQDSYLYVRDEVGGLLGGCFEPNAKPLPLSRLPTDFAFDLLDEDWDHLEPKLKNAIHRIPALETAEIRMLLNGPESFTLDNNFMLGESAEVPGL